MDRPASCRFRNGAGAAPPFAPEEYDARLLGLRAIMDGRGVDAVVLTSMHDIAWYSGFPCSQGRPCALVVTARDSVTVGADTGADRTGPGAASPDGGRAGFWTAVARVAGRDRAVGYDGDRLGIRQKARLEAALAPRETRDIAADIMRQRVRKSPAEIALIRQCAAVADLGGHAVRDALGAGAREIDLAMAARDAMELEIARRFPDAGCSDARLWLQSGPDAGGIRSPATARRVGRGDLLSLAVGPMVSGCCAALGRTLFARTADAASLAVWQAGIAAHEYGMSLLEPGATCAGIAGRIDAFLAERDLLRYRALGPGRRCAILSGCDGRDAGPAPRRDCGTVLEPGMVVGMELVLAIPPGRPGAGRYRQQDTLLIGGGGAEALTKYPRDPEFNIAG